MPLAESRRQQKASKTISIIAYLAFFTNSFFETRQILSHSHDFMGSVCRPLLTKAHRLDPVKARRPIFWCEPPVQAAFFEVDFRGFAPACTQKFACFFFFFVHSACFFPAVMLYYSRSCIIQTNVTGLHLCTFADATLYPARGQQPREHVPDSNGKPMQPYTPHGDSNFTPVGLTKAPGDATLYPARGQQPLHLCLFFATDLGCNLIPRTGTATSMRPTICVYLPGCNLIPRTGTATASPASRPGRTGWMQPYTPHGDSNDVDARPANTDPSDATLYPARGQQLCGPAAPGCRRVDATLYPARGQQRPLHRGHPGLAGMQPYTPHGDSNPVEPLGPQVQHGCNLIPRTGTATGLPALGGVALHLMQPYTPHGDSNHKSIHFAKFFEDATLYPARGQQHPGVQALCGRQRMQPYTPHGDSNSLRSV